ncbi:hypothetical protein DM860_015799 [Cuscuta australis]|uniref:RNA helicase n=1 Tax=Cuscuta australis TaxID=267555 RepID=A0A328DY74_9ASTE|nr:hypothetical protein DM860_015799 [Cuscuta australis]
MHRPISTAPGGRRRPVDHPSRSNPGPPFRHRPHPHNGWESDWPPRPLNFIVELQSSGQRAVSAADVEALVRKLRVKPQRSSFVPSKSILAALWFEYWSDAVDTVVRLWEMKLNGEGISTSFLPAVVCNGRMHSDYSSDLNDQLRLVFLERLEWLKEGDLVVKWLKKLGDLTDETKTVSNLLKKPQSLGAADELLRRRKGLQAEASLMLNRMQEFQRGIKCIEDYLESAYASGDCGVPVIQFLDGEMSWERIYMLMLRECRRLDDGLPIYAHRQEILNQIQSQQVTVLIGETGSGKSTQLVQYLCDSGFTCNGSIICTQPRKLAAISLAERVKEESCGCYDDTSVVCCPSYSSGWGIEPKVIFMTDHCLLQHYMSDKQLSRASCIIVDEAHERSLNTDLLLALIKNLLFQRPRLKLIIMSATVDADQFSDYFFGSKTLHVAGRSFPVDIKYGVSESKWFSVSNLMPSYVIDVLNMVMEINRIEGEGTILAFLTSQVEVEWACEKFQAVSAIAFPLHGKLSSKDQHRVFLTYPGKRKVIFATNIAETSLTIPGVKFVVDSGVVKESVYEPSTGMNVLKVCRISQSSANQRAGRAGRTEPGTCYRLYYENDFQSMLPHQEPEIRKVHLGMAVLRIVALGIKDVQDFDFVNAPSSKAIDMALRNLVQLGAIAVRNDIFELTVDGSKMVKLGVEPVLGKIILQCLLQRLGKEGLVLAAVMTNSSSIFCRVGTVEDKLKSDCLKVQFCHPKGDLFTLLAVYKEWETVPHGKKNQWCWENSINAKTMRRCHDTVKELEACLKNQMDIIVSSDWHWNPSMYTEHDDNLKNTILSSLPENVAMFSGYEQLGYEVALTRKHAQLHPSCSLLNFGQRPAWVVFREIISGSKDYLVCVTECDFEHFSALSPPPAFDFLNMYRRQLQMRKLTGFGNALLKRFYGKSNWNLCLLLSNIRESRGDERIVVEVNFDHNELLLYASLQDMEKVCSLVQGALDHEKKLLRNECSEQPLYNAGPTVLPSFSLFGSGAEIKHLELKKRYLSVDIFHSNINALDERELVEFLEGYTLGHICGISKYLDKEDKWVKVTFSTPEAATMAVELDQSEFNGGILKVVPSKNTYDGNSHTKASSSSSSIKAKISWPRRCSKGVAIVKCDPNDVALMVSHLSTVVLGGRLVRCKAGTKSAGSVVITGLDVNLFEDDISQVLHGSTNLQIKEFFVVRGDAVDSLPHANCGAAIIQAISPFMPGRNSQGDGVRVHVLKPSPKDNLMRATITFDRDLHLDAARALEQIDRKVLPGCLSWQKIHCQQMFHSSVSCPAHVYPVIRNQLDSLLASLRQEKGVECNLEAISNEASKLCSYRVKITAGTMKTVAELRKPLQQLMEGTVIHHPGITPPILQILFSRKGVLLMESIQRETGTHIIFDKHRMILRVYGSQENIQSAEESLVKALLALHQNNQLEIQLRDGILPPDMMKRVVQHFGADLGGLKQKVPEAGLSLNTRRHSISIIGTIESKQRVEEMIHSLAQTSPKNDEDNDDSSCPICFCELEDPYMLEDCCHQFCRSCLSEQIDSAIRTRDSFPLRCSKEGCGSPILLSDFRSLLSSPRGKKYDELVKASLDAYVAGSGGTYRFCPSPDCPSIYAAAISGPSSSSSSAPADSLFVCGACFVETCTQCHLEYHPFLSCEKYREFKDDPDSSLKQWCGERANVKACPGCGFIIEKVDGCDHISCKCGRHVCWSCLSHFGTGNECYAHMRSAHSSFAALFGGLL